MFEGYTGKVFRAIFFARYAASEFGTPAIEPEHLLLGALQADEDVVLGWLDHKIKASGLRDKVSEYISKAPRITTSVDIPLSEEAMRVLGYAEEEAQTLSHSEIGVEHLFLGLLRDPQPPIAKILREHGVDPKTVRETIMNKRTSPNPTTESPWRRRW